MHARTRIEIFLRERKIPRTQIRTRYDFKTRVTCDYIPAFYPTQIRNTCKAARATELRLARDCFNIPVLTVNQVGHTALSLVASDYAGYLNQCVTKLSKLLLEYCITSASAGGFSNERASHVYNRGARCIILGSVTVVAGTLNAQI